MAKITDEQKRNILFLYKNHSMSEICVITNLSITTVQNVIHDSGIKTRKGRRKIDSRKIIEDFDNGFTDISFLSKKYNCCEVTIRKILKDRDIPKKKREFKPQGKTADIISALKEIPNLSLIAKRYNVSRQYVFRVKEKHLKEIGNET